MTVSPGIQAAIDSSPHRNEHMAWRFDTVGTVVHDLLDKDQRLKGITPDEVRRLMELLRQQTEEYATTSMKVGDITIYIGGREIRVSVNRWKSSAKIPGLFADGQMPEDPGAHDRAAAQVNELLAQMGHAPQAIAGARLRNLSYKDDFETTEFTIITPECEGVYHLFGNYTHRPDDMRKIQSEKMAFLIDMRIKNRHRVLELRRQVENDVAKYLEPVEGMKVVGSTFNIDDYHTSKSRTLCGQPYAEIEVIGDTLRTQTILASPRDDGKTLKKLISRHRANFKKLDGRHSHEALMCEPILAAAIRSVASDHGAGLLKEIEAAVEGKSLMPTNPRKRGIGNISIHRGLISAPVTLLTGKHGVRFQKERLNVKPIKQLPETVVQGLPGRLLREVVDHPYLDGLTIKSVTINSYGLQIRPEPAPIALNDLLDELRKISLS